MKTRKGHSSAIRRLLAKLQLSGQRLITVGVRGVEIIQQTPALADHFEQTPSRTVVLDVFLEVLGQMVDAVRQQGNLHVRRPGVALVNPKFFNRLRFRFHTVRQFIIFFYEVGSLSTAQGGVKHFSGSFWGGRARSKMGRERPRPRILSGPRSFGGTNRPRTCSLTFLNAPCAGRGQDRKPSLRLTEPLSSANYYRPRARVAQG